MSRFRCELGRFGEDVACGELERLGYIILDRRFRTRHGEIDIVAREGGVVVFVEVKTRMDGNFGDPLEAVTWQKRRRLCRMAETYLAHRKLGDAPCRFDVVAILEHVDGRRTIDVVRSAFELGA